MKICPLITQASILDDKEILVHEIDEPELDKKTEQPAAAEKDIFMNPSAETKEKTSLMDDLGISHEVRFIAKSYRGQVECLGDLCRFHDDAARLCRFEQLLSGAGHSAVADEPMKELRAEIEKSWAFQQKSVGEIVALFKELEEQTGSRSVEMRGAFDEKLTELRALFMARADETKGAMDALSRTLEAKSSDIEGKIKAGDESIVSFRAEVSLWKGVLDKNVDAIGSELERHKKLVEELSGNHSDIVKIVEHQKKSLAEEEHKRQIAEAKRLNNAGVMAYHNGQYERALEQFKKAIEIDATFTEAYNNLGLTYTETNDEQRATEAFRKAIELSPDMGASYNNLGYVFYRLGSYQEAVEMYNEAIGRNKDSGSAYTNLGNAYYKLDRIEEAVDAWKKALEIDPGNEKAKRNLKRFHAEVK
jgi:tetratricopeptide (TPR) repeat protein